jgi:hypothetical protein
MDYKHKGKVDQSRVHVMMAEERRKDKKLGID